MPLHIPEGALWSTVWWDGEDSPTGSMLDAALEADPMEVSVLVVDEAYVPVGLEGE
jgi:hypothetical protein